MNAILLLCTLAAIGGFGVAVHLERKRSRAEENMWRDLSHRLYQSRLAGAGQTVQQG